MTEPSTFKGRKEPDHRHARVAALRISAIYLVIGLAWIGCSDWVLGRVAAGTAEPLAFTLRGEALKGWAFIFVTSGLLYFLVLSLVRSVQKQQRDSQQDVAQAAANYEALFLHNPLPMWVYELPSLRIVASNDAAVQVYGFTHEEFARMVITDLASPEEAERGAMVARSPGEGTRITSGWVHVLKNGQRMHVEAASHVTEFDGRPARFLMTRDITDRLVAEEAVANYRDELEKGVKARTAELSATNQQLQLEVNRRKLTEEQLVRAKELAEAANEAKVGFLANTSHEIRTPLTSILGYADLLLDPDLAPEQAHRYVTVLQQNASHLLKMIDDLLDLSRAEMGKIQVASEDNSPREIALQAIDLVRPRAVEKALNLIVDFVGEIPELIRTDGTRLRQILLNLLSNAIKFTQAGRVAMTVRTTSTAPETIRFEIADTGIGMTPENAERVFEPFYQVDHGPNRRYGGSGLGLAISREITQLLGGSIEVASKPNEGTVFTLILPLTKYPQSSGNVTPNGPAVMSLHGHILLADDNANVRWLVEEYLRRAGAEVTGVSDGQAAVDAVRESLEHGPPFDLIILDINMPVMDGTEAMRHIRALGYAGRIAALTAHAISGARAEWQNAGWDAVAPKPIDRQTFIPLVASLIEAGAKASAQPSQPS